MSPEGGLELVLVDLAVGARDLIEDLADLVSSVMPAFWPVP